MGIGDHKITDTDIVGELKRELGIHSISVFTKKVIYRIIKIAEKPHITMVLKQTENICSRKIQISMKGSKNQFEKKHCLSLPLHMITTNILR